jgi:hypothetical protein
MNLQELLRPLAASEIRCFLLCLASAPYPLDSRCDGRREIVIPARHRLPSAMTRDCYLGGVTVLSNLTW